MRALLLQGPMRGAVHAESMLRQIDLAVDRAPSIEDAEAALEVNGYDLLVVDLDAIDEAIVPLLRRARTTDSHLRLLVLGTRERMDTVAAALAQGADDFLIKPIDAGELRLRVNRLSARRTEQTAAVLECGPLQLHVNTGVVLLDGRRIELTPRERAVLHILLRENGNAVGKDYIASRIFSMDSDAAPTAIETYISRLRRKLTHPRIQIRTVHGLGYLLVQTATTIAAGLVWFCVAIQLLRLNLA
ncbi:MAG TPA: response regulator transcription factor [Hyphomicrobiaceae bacterium]|nr:response regulator transcription factor [Hyphomicrobiaceae bacterium]